MSLSMSNHNRFEQLRDAPALDEEESFASGKVMIKFCSIGIVTSRKWVSAYLTVVDSVVKIYDSKESCLANPQSFVLKIVLDKTHCVSDIKRKNYSQNKLKIIDFYCFYIQIDNGIFSPSRLVKIGCLDELQALTLVNSIKLSIGPSY